MSNIFKLTASPRLRGLGAVRGLGQDDSESGYTEPADNFELWGPGGPWEASSVSDAAVITSSVPAADNNFFQDILKPTLQIVADTGKAVLAYRTQEDINAINLQRLRQGQAPLPASYLKAMQPQVGVNVGVSTDLQKMLLWGGLGLGAVLLVSSLTRRGR